jgi:hypothetical protein
MTPTTRGRPTGSPPAIAGRSRSPTTKPVTDHWHGVEEWAAHHRGQGHHPHPAPTHDNPEEWACDCGTVWRILTMEQTRQKFAHLRKRRTPAHEAQ